MSLMSAEIHWARVARRVGAMQAPTRVGVLATNHPHLTSSAKGCDVLAVVAVCGHAWAALAQRILVRRTPYRRGDQNFRPRRGSRHWSSTRSRLLPGSHGGAGEMPRCGSTTSLASSVDGIVTCERRREASSCHSSTFVA